MTAPLVVWTGHCCSPASWCTPSSPSCKAGTRRSGSRRNTRQTSLIAALRGERDIAVGNVVGSNIFNALAVLGASALLAPGGIVIPAAALRFDIPVMIAVAVAGLPIFFTGHLIARWEGVLFLAYYAAYVLYVILDAVQHDALPQFSAVMLLFVLPLTALTLAVGVTRSVRGVRPGPRSRPA